MTLFLGVDGGGTGCRVILADDQGRALARATAGPANISSDPQTALGNILSATRTALAQALGAGQVEAALPRIIAGLGLAGANAAGASAWLAQALPFARCRIETDAITAVKGALRGDDGIVAAIGTGSVFGVQRAARIRQIGGWGFALGDEGSGAVLGRSLLSCSLRALDGICPMTPLLQEVLDGFGTPSQIVGFSLTARPADYATYAPRLIAAQNDPAASEIMAMATAEVAAAIAALQGPVVLPVIFIGGLGPTYAERITLWPQRPAHGSALDGALLLAQEAA